MICDAVLSGYQKHKRLMTTTSLSVTSYILRRNVHSVHVFEAGSSSLIYTISTYKTLVKNGYQTLSYRKRFFFHHQTRTNNTSSSSVTCVITLQSVTVTSNTGRSQSHVDNISTHLKVNMRSEDKTS